MIPGFAHLRLKAALHFEVKFKKMIKYWQNLHFSILFQNRETKPKRVTRNLSPGPSDDFNSTSNDTILMHFIGFLLRPGCVNQKWAPAIPRPQGLRADKNSLTIHMEVQNRLSNTTAQQ